MYIKRENLIALRILSIGTDRNEYTVNKKISVLKNEIDDLNKVTISIDDQKDIDDYLEHLNEILMFLDSDELIYNAINYYYSRNELETDTTNILERVANIFVVSLDIIEHDKINTTLILEHSSKTSKLIQIDLENKKILNIGYVD